MEQDEFALPEPAPAFARHFTHSLYDSMSDDLAPFGSDEGSDLLWTWGSRRAELDEASRLFTVLECEPDDVATIDGPMEGIDGVVTATFISSAAFVLLRLVGHLVEADRQAALTALDFLIEILPDINPAMVETPEVLRVQRDDLASWRNPT